MHRLYLQAGDTYKYAENSELRAIALYSDLNYQTPGGLTLAQMQADPHGQVAYGYVARRNSAKDRH